MSGTSVHPSLDQLSLACRRLRRPIVARREPQRERRAAADFAFDGDRAVELLDDALGDRQAEAEAAALGRDEVVEDRRQPLGRDARAGVGDADLDVVAGARRRDGDAAARLRSPESRW